MNIRRLLVFLTVFTSQLSFAVTVKGLYSSEVILPLISTEEKVIEKAYKLALEEVLTKVSGDSDVVAQILPLAEKSVAKWVQQRSIVDEQNLIELDDAIYSAKKVVVNFYPQSIDTFLFEQGAPVWGENRPSVLLWLIEQKQFQRKVAGKQSPSIMLNAIANSANQKGVPINVPLQDTVDRVSLTPSDLWGFFETPIITASQRYQKDAISVFKVTELAEGYEGVLMLLLPSEPAIRVDLQAEDESELANKATQVIAKIFSERYASTKNTGEITPVSIQVTNVANHEVLDKVQAYLANLGIIQNAYPAMINESTVQFTVLLNGDVTKMVNIINLDTVIVRTDSELNSDNFQIYQYNGK